MVEVIVAVVVMEVVVHFGHHRNDVLMLHLTDHDAVDACQHVANLQLRRSFSTGHH